MIHVRVLFTFLMLSAASTAVDAARPEFVPRVWNDFPVRVEIEDDVRLERLERLLPGRGPHAHDHVLDGAIEVRVTETEFRLLERGGFAPERIEDLNRRGRTQAEEDWRRRAEGLQRALPTFPLQTYLSHTEIGQLLEDLQTLRPDLALRYSYGTSIDGRELWGLVISDQPGVDEPEPEVRLAAGIHGDETVMTVMLLNLAHELVTRYGTLGAERLTEIVDGTELHIQPLFNPDGYVRGIRRNAAGVDLNRNFPEPAGTQSNRQPETDDFIDHALTKNFVVSLMGHGGALVVNYPWDYTFTRAPDDAALIRMSLAYSQTNLPMYNGAFSQGITNGADWYVATGTLQDWVYDQTNCFDVTLETSNTKWPPSNQLLGFWGDNRESLLSFVETARAGVHGIVTDAVTGDPLDAVITVDGIDAPVVTDPATGDFYKLLDDGNYSIQIDAEGYESRTFFRVFNTWGTPRELDVALQPVATSSPVARLATRIDRVVPNPFNPRTRIEFSLGATERARVSLIDARGRHVRTLLDETLEAGTHDVAWSGEDDRGSRVAAGVYFVRLEAGDVRRSARVTLIP